MLMFLIHPQNGRAWGMYKNRPGRMGRQTFRCAKPLVAVGDEVITAQRGNIQRDHANAMGSINQNLAAKLVAEVTELAHRELGAWH